jgi:hypothetical protein
LDYIYNTKKTKNASVWDLTAQSQKRGIKMIDIFGMAASLHKC